MTPAEINDKRFECWIASGGRRVFDASVKRILILTATLVACSLAVTSCNTIGGVGKDVKSVGSDISGAAEAASGSL